MDRNKILRRFPIPKLNSIALNFPVILSLLGLLTLLGCGGGHRNISEYVDRVAPLIDPQKLETLGERGANPRVLKIVYWLDAAGHDHAPPTLVLDSALTRVGMKGKAADLTRAELLRNLDIATKLGCLTGDDLEEMRHGKAPIVRRGPYAGDKLSVDHIIPLAIAPELDTVLANLELLPLKVNESKNAKVGDRQRAVARQFYKARLLSREGFDAVMKSQ